jgi:methylenetetrahydrofolate dehydrogenase (NADP+)/methenyltetrahydrofolate cyclohydrolase
MSALLLDGRAAADAILAQLKPKVAKRNPVLAIVQVGDDPASSSYVKQKLNSCAQIGMLSEHRHLPADASEDDLRRTVEELNANDAITGFIVQLPLPGHLAHFESWVRDAILPEKDIDGFGAWNTGRMLRSKEDEIMPPATPAGIVALLEHYKIPLAGKHVVIVGRSATVGKPLAVMLLHRDATVTVCHSKTLNLHTFTTQADILVVAVGKPKMITAEMVKNGAVVVDVGINRIGEKLVGDTDFDGIRSIASAITPVPGGVGPMTVAALIANCVRAKELQQGEL